MTNKGLKSIQTAIAKSKEPVRILQVVNIGMAKMSNLSWGYRYTVLNEKGKLTDETVCFSSKICLVGMIVEVKDMGDGQFLLPSKRDALLKGTAFPDREKVSQWQHEDQARQVERDAERHSAKHQKQHKEEFEHEIKVLKRAYDVIPTEAGRKAFLLNLILEIDK